MNCFVSQNARKLLQKSSLKTVERSLTLASKQISNKYYRLLCFLKQVNIFCRKFVEKLRPNATFSAVGKLG